jgi:hypothetical protein
VSCMMKVRKAWFLFVELKSVTSLSCAVMIFQQVRASILIGVRSGLEIVSAVTIRIRHKGSSRVSGRHEFV